MLAKVIAHAPTRAEAAGRLALALERLHLGGVTTNRGLPGGHAARPAFLAGDTTTDFIERVAPAAAVELDDEARGPSWPPPPPSGSRAAPTRSASPTAPASTATGLSGRPEMVEGGPIDVLTGDWLAELTMLILARTRAKRPRRAASPAPSSPRWSR
jgi:hypothetical protein